MMFIETRRTRSKFREVEIIRRSQDQDGRIQVSLVTCVSATEFAEIRTREHVRVGGVGSERTCRLLDE